MALKTVTDANKRMAAKAGKLPKAPKKPSKSASVTVLDNYIKRYNAYVDRINKMADEYRKRQALIKQIF